MRALYAVNNRGRCSAQSRASDFNAAGCVPFSRVARRRLPEGCGPPVVRSVAACRRLSSRCAVRRLFIDEITAVADWERGLKRVIDRGELRSVLVVTTGSRATDLRRGKA